MHHERPVAEEGTNSQAWKTVEIAVMTEEQMSSIQQGCAPPSPTSQTNQLPDGHRTGAFMEAERLDDGLTL
jgi:hypothetical protein